MRRAVAERLRTRVWKLRTYILENVSLRFFQTPTPANLGSSFKAVRQPSMCTSVRLSGPMSGSQAMALDTLAAEHKDYVAAFQLTSNLCKDRLQPLAGRHVMGVPLLQSSPCSGA